MSRPEAEQPEAIAPDAMPLIRAFRDAGCVSFEKLGVGAARLAYEQSCATNGLERIQMRSVVDMTAHANAGPTCRVYTPDTAGSNPPVVVFFHGGGWVIGSLETHDPLCRFIAHAAGAIVVSVDYRLAPESPYPAAINDGRQALRWLMSSARPLGFTPERFAIMGDSAGGGLAAVLANDYSSSLAESVLAAQVLLYPVTDLTMSSGSYSRITSGFPLTAATMSWFIDQYAPHGTVDRSDPSLSPLHGVRATPARALVVTVGLDPLAEEGVAYAGALANAGGRVEHLHLPHHAHGLFTSAGAVPTGRAVLERVGAFLSDALHAQ